MFEGQWTELFLTHGYYLWIGLCVFVLAIGFALCANNVRRQILICAVLFFVGIGLSYYEEFYNAPIARYLWFPHWVFLESCLILLVYYIEPVHLYICSVFKVAPKKIDSKELQQEKTFAIICLLLLMSELAQLASALYGTGRTTAGIYDHTWQLLVTVAVLVLVLPGKTGLTALKDAFNEKVTGLVSHRANSN